MIKDSAQVVQAMPLLEGKVNLSAGIHKVNELIHCVVDGSIVITWSTGTIATIDMLAGQDYAFVGGIDISSGKFHIS